MKLSFLTKTLSLLILTACLLPGFSCRHRGTDTLASGQADREDRRKAETKRSTASLAVVNTWPDRLLQLQASATACKEEKNWILWADYRLEAADYCFESGLLSTREVTEQLEDDLQLLSAVVSCRQDTACQRAALRLKPLLAWLYSEKLRNYESARKHYEDVQYIHENSQQKIKNPGRFLYKPLGSIYTRLGDDDKALATLNKAIVCLKDSTQLRDLLRLSELYGEKAIVFHGQSRYDEGVAACRQGLAVLDNLKQTGQRLSPGDEQGFNDARGFLLMKLAQSLIGKGAWAEAQNIVTQGQGMTLSLHYLLGWKGLEAEINTLRGNHTTAVNAYKELLKLAADNQLYPPKSRETAKIELALGRELEQLNAPDEALVYYQRALCSVLDQCNAGAVDFMPDPATFYPENVIMEALTAKGMLLYSLYPQRGDSLLYLAYASLRLAIEQESKLMGTYSYESSKLKLLEESHRRHEKMVAVCYELFELTGSPYYLDRVFHYMEKSRAVVLNEALCDKALLQQMADSQALIQEQRLIRQLQFYAQENFEIRANPAQVDSSRLADIEAGIASTKLAYDRLLNNLQEEKGYLLREKIGMQIAGIPAIQHHLKTRGMDLIIYFFNDSNQELYIVRLTPDDLLVHRQCLPPDFYGQLEDFKQQVYDWQSVENSDGDLTSFRRFAEHASNLYDLLIRPVSREKLRNRLVIVPDGPLSNFPFDLLVSDRREYKEVDYARLPYLIRESALHQAFSATVLLQSETRSSRFRHAYLGIAPDYSNSQLGRVVRSREVVSTLAAQMPGGKSLTGEKAVKDSFLQQASAFRILHFYGHAEANITNPVSSWLAFTPPPAGTPQASVSRTAGSPGLLSSQGESTVPLGTLQLFELYGLTIPAELVVLSACETGKGKYAPGEGVISLARAFRHAGCPSTLMTLWKIKDEYGSVAAINLAFFGYLQKGYSKDVALQRAKLDYLDLSANPAHPAYWSAFVLIGDEQAMQLGLPIGKWLSIFAILAVLATLVWVYKS
jgi:CHAT domain-containing protein